MFYLVIYLFGMEHVMVVTLTTLLFQVNYKKQQSAGTYVLNQIQEMMHLKKEKHLKSVEGMQYQRYIEGEPKFSELMTLYAHNLSRLYARVLKKYQNPRSGNS